MYVVPPRPVTEVERCGRRLSLPTPGKSQGGGLPLSPSSPKSPLGWGGRGSSRRAPQVTGRKADRLSGSALSRLTSVPQAVPSVWAPPEEGVLAQPE